MVLVFEEVWYYKLNILAHKILITSAPTEEDLELTIAERSLLYVFRI